MAEAYNHVMRKYFFDNRHYHGIEHINSMLKNCMIYGAEILDDTKNGIDDAMYYAILFHDYIYDSHADQMIYNEVRSAHAWQQYFVDNTHDFEDHDYGYASNDEDYCSFRYDDLFYQVTDMIKATAHHFDGTEYTDYRTNLLLDLDILGFADSFENFEKTQFEIDKEFHYHYDPALVAGKRKEFLQNILDNKLLKFRVIDHDGTLTARAYENIARLLNPFIWKRN